MTSYHINRKGLPAICKASPGNCPLGNNEQHFTSEEAAQDFANNVEESKHGILPELNVNTIGITKEWQEKFLNYEYFDELVDNHVDEIIKDELFEGSEDLYKSTVETWKDLHYANSAKNLKELTQEEAIQVIVENTRVGDLTGWFREFDSDYKPKIERTVMTNPELRNASLNVAHRVYQESTGSKVDFDSFVNSEIEVYRGGNFDFIENDVFVSYSFDREVAESFANKIKGSEVITKKVKIRDTLGSLQTTGEAELMVRRDYSEGW